MKDPRPYRPNVGICLINQSGLVWMGKGETLICSGRDCFGTKPERQDANLEYIRDGGIEVRFVQKSYFEGNTGSKNS